MATCPNTNLDSWKSLVSARGEDIAYYLWDKYDGTVPKKEYSPDIKPGVEELFDSSPELANAVYEALGFKESSDYFLTNLRNQNIRKFEEIKDSHSLIESLKNFAFITDKQIELLNKFKTKTKNIPVTITTLPIDKKGRVGAQVRNDKGGVPFEIQFDKEIGNNIHFAIHELSHQYIWENFSNQDILDLELLFDEFKKQFGTKEYGFSSETEFLAEIISNQAFYEKVKDLKLNEKALVKSRVERFFEKLSKIFKNLFQDNYNKNLSFVDNVTNYYYGISLKANQITPQQKQQAQQLYSQYLDSIFPDSKVKDIVYHGTANDIQEFTDKTLNYGKGVYFTKDFDYATTYRRLDIDKPYAKNGGKNIPVFLNVTNPKLFKNTKNFNYNEFGNIIEKPKNNDAYILDEQEASEYVVFEPEQIHILGGKQDIEGFKQFVSKETIAPSEPMFQLEGTPSSVASPELVQKVKELLKKMGVKVQDILEYAKGSGLELGGVNGLADLTQKLIAIAEGKEDVAITEEMVHIASSIIEQKNPKLITEMIAKIDRFKIYNQVYKKYKDVYKLPNGKPDIRKIKKEAVDKLIAEVIINKNGEIEQYPELREEENQSFVRKMWNTMLDFIRGMYRKSDISIFEQVGDKIMSGNIEGTVEDLKGGGVFFQATEIQGKIQGLILDTRNRIIKKVEDKKESDPLLLDSEEANNYYELSKENGEKEIVKNRVTNRVKGWYKKLFGTKTFTKQEKAFNELKRKFGVEGHADFEEIHARYYNADGTKKTTPSPRPDKFNLPSEAMYSKLEQYYVDLINSFKEGTLVFSEVIVYDPKEKEAGTIDFLAVEPSGKSHILDWKFMHIKGDDVAWFKRGAFDIQLRRYREMLTDYYGVKEFGMRRAIPISIEFTPKNKANLDEGFNLKGIAIGSVDPKKIEDIKLLPISEEKESTGFAALDKIIEKLNSTLKQIDKEKVTNQEEREFKIERQNVLRAAIKKMQTQTDLTPLIDVIRVLEKDGVDILNRYKTIYKNKPARTDDINNNDLSNFAEEMREFLISSDMFVNIARDLRSLIYSSDIEKSAKTEEQKEDVKFRKKLYEELGASSDNIYDFREAIKQATMDFADKHIGERNLVFGLLKPEKIVKGVASLFRGVSELGLKSLEILTKLTGEAQSRAAADSLSEVQKIIDIREKFVKQGGDWIKNVKKVYQKDEKGNIVNKLIYKYRSDFLSTVDKEAENANLQWIKDNIDIKEYEKEAKEKIEKSKKYIRERRYSYDDAENEEIKRREIRKVEKQYDINDKEFTGHNNYIIKRHPLPKWYSEEYKAIQADANLKELYEFIVSFNNKAKEIGYIDNQISKFFLPFIRKSMAEELAMDGNLSAMLKWGDKLKMNPDDIGYGAFDERTGELQNSIPKYYTYDFTYKDGVNDYSDVSEDLFKNLILYVQQVNKYKYLLEVEGQLKLVKTIEDFKNHLVTDKIDNVVWENDAPKERKGNEENSKTFDDFLRVMLYDQKYILSDADLPYNAGAVINFVKDGVNKLAGREIWKKDETPSANSLFKTVDAANRAFQIKTLGLEFISGAVNWFGGNVQMLAQIGQYFTEGEFVANQLKLITQSFNSEDDKTMFVQLINTFMPLKDDPSYELYKEAGMSVLTRGNVSDFLFLFMRKPEILLEKTIFISILQNTMIENGKLLNIREYVKNKYKNRFDSSASYRESKDKIEKEIEELKKTRSLNVTKKLVDGKLEIPGLDLTNRQELQRITNLSRDISSKITGSMTKNQVNKASQNIWIKSMMLFKGWIPKLAETRFGEFRKVSDDFSVRVNEDGLIEGQKYDVGRARLLWYFLSDGIITGTQNLINIIYLNDAGIAKLDEAYEDFRQKYKLRFGETLNMSREDFIELVRTNLKNQVRELLILASLLGSSMALGFFAPDDDEDKSDRNRFRYAQRVIDKFVGELSFFYNPAEMEKTLSGGIFPAVGLAADFGRFIKHFTLEMTGMDMDPDTTIEDVRKKAQPVKNLMKMLPVTKSLVTYLSIFSNEFAKEYDVTIQKEANR